MEKINNGNINTIKTPLSDLQAKIYQAIEKKCAEDAIFYLEELREKAGICPNVSYFSAYVYLEIGREEDAICEAEQALTMGCLTAEMYRIIGFAQRRLLHYYKAIAALEKSNAIVLDGDQSVSESDFIGRNLLSLAQLYLYIGNIEKSKKTYLSASRFCTSLKDKQGAYSSYLLCLHYDEKVAKEDIFVAHLRYNQFFPLLDKSSFILRNKKKNKIRIAYISPNFCRHVMCFFYQAFLRNYNKAEFEVYCYCLNEEDEITEQIRSFADQWKNVQHLTPDKIAKLIYQDEIDILFDLAGHSANNALPILKYHPALVQISGLGYFNTTGLEEVDYFLTDQYVDPLGQDDQFFTEKLIRLQHSHFCYKPWDDVAEIQSAPCIENGYITFGCFNKYAKITDEVLYVWKEILQQVKNSRLVLKSMIYRDEEMIVEIKKRLTKFGIDYNRVEFRRATSNYMNELLDIDIMLDTFPYPGGGMTCDALYMGVPVIVLEGNRHGARFGASILINAGLGELIAKDKKIYIERAVGLAQDNELLDILHKNLREMMKASPLMDAKAYMAEIEEFYKYAIEKKWSGKDGEKQ